MNRSFFSYLDEWSDITDITFRDRPRLGPLDKASHRIMRGPGRLSFADREMIAAYVSGLNACSFCYGSHEAVAAEFGVESHLLEELVDNLDQAAISENNRVLLRYVQKLTLSPSKMSRKDAEAVYEMGWTEEDLHLVVLITSLFNFYNRLLDGHGVKGNGAIYQMGGKHLSRKGYKVPWFIGAIKNIIFKAKRKQLKTKTN
tara:strand:+ start:2793 stop:3395 length:603 start_codon:yes stop_codon:yes gene_type:complete